MCFQCNAYSNVLKISLPEKPDLNWDSNVLKISLSDKLDLNWASDVLKISLTRETRPKLGFKCVKN